MFFLRIFKIYKVFLRFLFLFYPTLLLADFSISLKNQQPNWRIEVVEKYSDGRMKKVEYFAPIPKSEMWEKVKEREFSPLGTILRESDLKNGIKDGITIVYDANEKIENNCILSGRCFGWFLSRF